METLCKVCGGKHVTGACTEKKAEVEAWFPTKKMTVEEIRKEMKKHGLRLATLQEGQEFINNNATTVAPEGATLHLDENYLPLEDDGEIKKEK